MFYKNKVQFVDILSRRRYIWDTAVLCGSEYSHNVVQLNADEDKYYLLTPYPTLLPPLKKFLPESIKAIARNPNNDLQSIGICSKSDIQHNIHTQQFQETRTKKYHLYMNLKTKIVMKQSQNSIKMKYILSIHSPEEHIFGIQQSYMDQKIATKLYN